MSKTLRKLLGFKYRNKNNANVPGWDAYKKFGYMLGCPLGAAWLVWHRDGKVLSLHFFPRHNRTEGQELWLLNYSFGKFWDFTTDCLVRQFGTRTTVLMTREQWDDRQAAKC